MPIRAALFDFDGTLADSFAAIAASTNFVRTSFGLPELPEAVIRESVGLGLPVLMELLVPNAPTDEAVRLYREHHPTVMAASTHLMPGVAETIPELFRQGVRMAVCSNKRVEFTRQLVNALGLGDYFLAVLGPDDVGGRAKPNPAMVLEGLARVGATAAEAVYVGDMSVDVRTARAAGVPVWIVLGGAMGKEAVEEANPDRVLTGFAELLALLTAV